MDFLVVATIFFVILSAFYIKSISLNKPSRTTFAIIKVINVFYFIESLLTFVIKNFTSFSRDKIKVTQVITYPIKSCKGVSLNVCEIDEHGLRYDRMYMFGVWDKKRYKSVTQRECPKLCLCTIEIVGSSFKVQWPNSNECFYLPMEMDESYLQRHSSPKESPVHLWEVEFNTSVLDGVVPLNFIKDIGLPLDTKVLFSKKGKFVKTNVPKPLRATKTTKFQEYFPLLLMSEEDLADVESRILAKDFPISFQNFRPNIVVKGLGKPYSIDHWNKITIGGHRWLIVSKCPRCTIPNINYETGEPDPKNRISKELLKFRRCDPGNPYFMFLGVHGIQIDTGYKLQVGDLIEVQQKLINYYKPLE